MPNFTFQYLKSRRLLSLKSCRLERNNKPSILFATVDPGTNKSIELAICVPVRREVPDRDVEFLGLWRAAEGYFSNRSGDEEAVVQMSEADLDWHATAGPEPESVAAGVLRCLVAFNLRGVPATRVGLALSVRSPLRTIDAVLTALHRDGLVGTNGEMADRLDQSFGLMQSTEAALGRATSFENLALHLG